MDLYKAVPQPLPPLLFSLTISAEDRCSEGPACSQELPPDLVPDPCVVFHHQSNQGPILVEDLGSGGQT